MFFSARVSPGLGVILLFALLFPCAGVGFFFFKTGIWATLRDAYLFDLFSSFTCFSCACHEHGFYVPRDVCFNTGFVILSLLFFSYDRISPYLILFLSHADLHASNLYVKMNTILLFHSTFLYENYIYLVSNLTGTAGILS